MGRVPSDGDDVPCAAAVDPVAAGPDPIPDPTSERPLSAIHRLAASTAALWVAAAWGAAEASLFFLVPDLWVMFVALFAPWRTPKALLAAVTGALVGAAVLWWLAPALPSLGTVIGALPGLRPADLVGVSGELADRGLGAFLGGPLQGLPVKVYIHQAALLGQPLLGVLVMVALNRIERVGLSAIAAAIVGLVFRRQIGLHPTATVVGYVVLVVVFYATYFAMR